LGEVKKKKKNREGEGNGIPSHFNPGLLSLPSFHEKDLRICSTWMMALLGRIKREDHYMTCTAKIIEGLFGFAILESAI